MRLIIYILNGTILISSLYSCTEIIEPDISKEQVKLISPTENYISSNTTILFKWNEMEFATSYRLQIVSPSFSIPNQWVIDTSLANANLALNLFPGTFEWRVKAINSSWESIYSYRKFTIAKDTDITQQSIHLISPKSFDTTNLSTVLFQWESLPDADMYTFRLSYNGNLVFEHQLSQDSMLININHGEGTYIWMVRGENQYYNTAFFSRSLTLDTIPPGMPELVIPLNNTTFADSIVNFGWERTGTSIAFVNDSLLVSSDSLMSTSVIKLRTSQTWTQEVLSAGTYYWKVKSIDAANNQSVFSETRKLIITTK